MTDPIDNMFSHCGSSPVIANTMAIVRSPEFQEISRILDQIENPELKKLLKRSALEFLDK
jgi:hypothetical protein